jgi:KRAB domain-containing zinc finger protein
MQTHGIPKPPPKKPRKFHCPTCDFIAPSMAVLTEHNTSVHREEYQCSSCTKTYKSQGGLRKHQKTHNPDATKLQCTVCQRTFYIQSALKRHMKVHSDDRPNMCPTRGCKKAFKEMTELRAHMQKHAGEEFPCSQCDYKATSKKNLSSHMDKHVGVKCQTCGQVFDHRQKLKNHRIKMQH